MLGSLDPIACKEAALFIVYTGPFDPQVAVAPVTATLFVTPFYATHGTFGPRAKKQRLFTGYTGPLDLRQDMATQKRGAAKIKS